MSKLDQKANQLYLSGKFEEASKLYKKLLNSVSFNDLPIIYYNIGLCNYSLYNFEASEKNFQKSFDGGFKYAGHELSMVKMNLGKIEEGLDLYKFRYFGNKFSFPNLPLRKLEKFQEINGSRILVLNEQGFGDEILFSRSIKMLSDHSKFTKYQVYNELIDLFRNNLKYDNIQFFDERSFNIDFIKDFDYWVPSGDLFSIFTKKYGFDFIRFESKNKPSAGKVGICWKTNQMSSNSHLRSIDPDKLRDKLDDKYESKVSLQKGESLDWISPSNIGTFSDTFHIINECESVYSVDTSVLHLSMISGSKTNMLYNDYIDWRWKFPFYGEIPNKIQII